MSFAARNSPVINLDAWMMWLRDAEALISVPMLVAGLALLLGGWRMGIICVAATYGVTGALATWYFVAERPGGLAMAAGGAVVLLGLSLLLRRYAIPALGGALGALVLVQVLHSFGMREWPLWISAVVGFGCLTALAYAHAREVVILVTSLEGAGFLLSGIIPVLAASPGLFRFFQGLSRSSDVFLPFLILVPTMTGVFLQMADARNQDAGMTQA